MDHLVSFLPPLVLNFELPADYPSTSPPIFNLSSKWMTVAQVAFLSGILSTSIDDFFFRPDSALLPFSRPFTSWIISATHLFR